MKYNISFSYISYIQLKNNNNNNSTCIRKDILFLSIKKLKSEKKEVLPSIEFLWIIDVFSLVGIIPPNWRTTKINLFKTSWSLN